MFKKLVDKQQTDNSTSKRTQVWHTFCEEGNQNIFGSVLEIKNQHVKLTENSQQSIGDLTNRDQLLTTENKAQKKQGKKIKKNLAKISSQEKNIQSILRQNDRLIDQEMYKLKSWDFLGRSVDNANLNDSDLPPKPPTPPPLRRQGNLNKKQNTEKLAIPEDEGASSNKCKGQGARKKQHQVNTKLDQQIDQKLVALLSTVKELTVEIKELKKREQKVEKELQLLKKENSQILRREFVEIEKIKKENQEMREIIQKLSLKLSKHETDHLKQVPGRIPPINVTPYNQRLNLQNAPILLPCFNTPPLNEEVDISTNEACETVEALEIVFEYQEPGCSGTSVRHNNDEENDFTDEMLFSYLTDNLPEISEQDLMQAVVTVLGEHNGSFKNVAKTTILKEVKARFLLEEFLKKEAADDIERCNKQLESSCIICFEEMLPGHMQKLSCSHTYHKLCIKQWLKKNNICPICRNKQNERRYHIA